MGSSLESMHSRALDLTQQYLDSANPNPDTTLEQLKVLVESGDAELTAQWLSEVARGSNPMGMLNQVEVSEPRRESFLGFLQGFAPVEA